MIKFIELSSVPGMVHLDSGLTDFLKKQIEETYLNEKPIIKFALSRTDEGYCALEVVSSENENHIFEDIEVFDHRFFESDDAINNNTKAMVYSLKYFTRPYSPDCERKPVSPDYFPEIEVEFKPSLLEFINHKAVLGVNY
ncbi:MAG TPA: hypothetical protein PLS73_06220 [Saprospiraceae bacterium]|nr:hypothetical protein [Saprospiraceae bacterium]